MLNVIFNILRKPARIFLSRSTRRRLVNYLYYPLSLWENSARKKRISHEQFLQQKYEDIHSILKRLQYRFLKKLKESTDQRYQKQFAKFEVALRHVQENRDHNYKGVICMIASLESGGAERQVVLTLLKLKQQKVSPLALITFPLDFETDRFYLPQLEATGIATHELDLTSNARTLNTLSPLILAARMLPSSIAHEVIASICMFAEKRPAIVHLWLDASNIIGGLAAVALGIPKIILSGRNLPPNHLGFYQPYMCEAYRWLLHQPNVIMLNNSQAGARSYEQWLDLPTGFVRVLYNGFDFDYPSLDACMNHRFMYRVKHHIPDHVPIIGTVIRFEEEKRPLLWVEIAAQIHRLLPEVHFLMVGDGPLHSKAKAHAVASGLKEVLHFVGPEQEVFSAIATMDIFLLSSRVEGTPNVLIEAQALGVPVVTTNAGGAPEVLVHGKTGWVLESDQPDEAAAVVARLLLDKHWCERASFQGREFVQKTFGADRMINDTLNVYNNLK